MIQDDTTSKRMLLLLEIAEHRGITYAELLQLLGVLSGKIALAISRLDARGKLHISNDPDGVRRFRAKRFEPQIEAQADAAE